MHSVPVPAPQYDMIARTAGGGILCQGDAQAAEHAYNLQFDMLVLCAEEHQPAAADIGGPDMTVIHAPNDDADRDLHPHEAQTAERASEHVRDALLAGKRVLVTCWQGRNRSGLVSALALHKLTGCAGHFCATIVKSKRRGALTNTFFTDYLDKIRPLAKSA